MSTSVRAKFRVTSKTEHPTNVKDGNGGYKPGLVYDVILAPVVGTGNADDENSKFYAATPSGELKLGWISKETADLLENGKEYYLDITPAFSEA